LKSSPYGLYILGYTRVTKVKTNSCKKEIFSKSKKITKFGLFSEIRKHEVEIVSNRKLVRYGE